MQGWERGQGRGGVQSPDLCPGSPITWAETPSGRSPPMRCYHVEAEVCELRPGRANYPRPPPHPASRVDLPAGEGAEVQSWLWCSFALCVTVGTYLPSLGSFSICAMGLSWLQEPLDSVPVLGPMERDEAQGTESRGWHGMAGPVLP